MKNSFILEFPEVENKPFCITYTKDLYNLRIPTIMEYSTKIKKEIIYKGSLKACLIQLQVYWTARINAMEV